MAEEEVQRWYKEFDSEQEIDDEISDIANLFSLINLREEIRFSSGVEIKGNVGLGGRMRQTYLEFRDINGVKRNARVYGHFRNPPNLPPEGGISLEFTGEFEDGVSTTLINTKYTQEKPTGSKTPWIDDVFHARLLFRPSYTYR